MNGDQLHIHSLKVILDNQQQDGAYLACPVMPDYQYSWFRDGAFIAYALTLDGDAVSFQYNDSTAAQWESATRFHDWCVRIINAREERIERTMMRAVSNEPINLQDTLNARYRPEGESGPDGWPEFQLDGPGTWLWSLAEHVRIARINPLPCHWENAIRLASRYLAALWKTPCYDCWEERGQDIHISTLGAIFGGLTAAQNMVADLDFQEELADIRAFVLNAGLTPDGELAKSVGLNMVDANLLGVAVPHGMFRPDDALIQRTVARIERELHANHSGVHRHLDDVYYGGGTWVLLALWLAWYYVEVGKTGEARALVAWAQSQQDDVGNLPEQTNSFMLASEHYLPWVEQRGPIANPLLWTHAKYMIVRRKLGGTLDA